MQTLNENTKRILKKETGLSYEEIEKLSQEEIENSLSKKIGKKLKLKILKRGIIPRGSVYLMLDRILYPGWLHRKFKKFFG